jgi:hypothetical protein
MMSKIKQESPLNSLSGKTLSRKGRSPFSNKYYYVNKLMLTSDSL